jgi:hypothetical protein
MICVIPANVVRTDTRETTTMQLRETDIHPEIEAVPDA